MADRDSEQVGLNQEPDVSLADLFLAASRALAKSDARIYRSVDLHLRRTRDSLENSDSENEVDPQEALVPSVNRLLIGPPSFERQPRKSLERLCKQNGISGYSRMNKEAIILRLKAHQIKPPHLPLEALSKAELIEIISEFFVSKRHDSK